MSITKDTQLKLAKKILLLPEDASFADVKKQFHILSSKFHPDKGGDPEIFNKILISYRFIEKYSKELEIHNQRASVPVVKQEYSSKESGEINSSQGEVWDTYFRGKEIDQSVQVTKNNFNNVFESNRASEYDIPTVDAYLQARESSKKRETIDIQQDYSVTKGNFNDKFSNIKRNCKDIIIYEGVQFTDISKSANASWDHFEEQSLLINTDRVKLEERSLSQVETERSRQLKIKNLGNPQSMTVSGSQKR